jgi:acyl-coenzyme A thioesterase PaaI-like protein
MNKIPQTLEELADDVVAAGLVQFPESVTVSLSIHYLEPALLEEFVDGCPQLVRSKRRSHVSGQRYAELEPGPNGLSLTLFEKAPTPQVTTW